jgi:hypothetical protein
MNAPTTTTTPWNWQENFRKSTMRSFLKVKIKYLAEEGRIIKDETAKSRKARRELDAKGKPWSGLAKAAEHLREHRLFTVRPAARYALLAYAFLRGVQYRRLERKAEYLPVASEIAKVAWRFAAKPQLPMKEYDPKAPLYCSFVQEIQDWLTAPIEG